MQSYHHRSAPVGWQRSFAGGRRRVRAAFWGTLRIAPGTRLGAAVLAGLLLTALAGCTPLQTQTAPVAPLWQTNPAPTPGVTRPPVMAAPVTIAPTDKTTARDGSITYRGQDPVRPAQYGGQVMQPVTPDSPRTVYQNPADYPSYQPAPDPAFGMQGAPPGSILSEPTADPTIPLEAIATENQTGRIMFGVGVNSEAGVVGSAIIDEQNFDWRRFPSSWEDVRSGRAWRGAGQRFRIEAAPGTEVQRYLINFQEPYLLPGLPVSFGVSGYFFNRRYNDWDEERLGGRVNLGYYFTPDLSGTVALRAEQVDISRPRVPTPPELAEVLGTSDLYTVRGDLRYDTRDNTFLATEGQLIELALEQGFGSFQFPRATIDARQHFLLRQRPDSSGRHVLSFLGRLGFAGEDTPLYEHFFAGGFSTMRGFRFRGASPVNMGVIVGGEFQMLGTAEYLFPITADDMLRGVTFVDFGTVEESVKITEFRVAPGFGLRITIPAMGPAPIALDFSFPVAKADTDQTQLFSFFVGFNR